MKLFSHKIGDGKPVVILHGLFGMSDNWLAIGKGLAQDGFAIHLIDIRNHGQSPHMPTHSYLDICDDLLQYLQQENINEVSIVGHSMGGKAAMVFGLLHPKKVTHLAVIDIAPADYGDHSISYHLHIIRNLMEIDLSSYRNRQPIMEEMERRLQDHRLTLFLGKSIKRDTVTNFKWKLNLPVLLQSLPAMAAGFDGLDKQAPSPVRTLFVKGEASDYILPRHEPDRMKYFPRSSVVSIANAGHWLHVEQPQKLLELLAAFLEENTSSKS
ncbi:MAG: alpha/beta fold hydrolase [Desulforhopalus sp.]